MRAIGQAFGLVWTTEGSSLIQIKAKIRKGTGKIYVDGDIDHDFLANMETAYHLFEDNNNFNLNKHNITFDVPGPVDGFSCGLAMFVALHSALAKQPINQNVAFTGGLSETGAVLAVPGIIEKLKAARRADLDTIVMPMENMPELPRYADIAPWGNLAICPIVRALEAVVISLPGSLTKANLKTQPE